MPPEKKSRRKWRTTYGGKLSFVTTPEDTEEAIVAHALWLYWIQLPWHVPKTTVYRYIYVCIYEYLIAVQYYLLFFKSVYRNDLRFFFIFNLMTKLHSYSCVLEWVSSTSLFTLPKKENYVNQTNNIVNKKQKQTRKYKGVL